MGTITLPVLATEQPAPALPAADIETAVRFAPLAADKIAGMEPDEQFKYLLAEVKKAAGFRAQAQECARDAGPYIHPRLASIEQAVKGGFTVTYDISDKPLTPEEWIAEYATPETEH
jgi:hypothetical protein